MNMRTLTPAPETGASPIRQRARGLPRWIAPAVLAAAMGMGTFAAPAPAQAQDSLARVLVDIADVVFRSGTPYYRYGDYGRDDRLVVGRDRYGRIVYYRVMPRDYRYDRVRSGPPYGNAYGYYRHGPGSRNAKCNRHGKCKSSYYDPRYDRRYSDRDHDDRYRDDRYRDGHDRYDRDHDDD